MNYTCIVNGDIRVVVSVANSAFRLVAACEELLAKAMIRVFLAYKYDVELDGHAEDPSGKLENLKSHQGACLHSLSKVIRITAKGKSNQPLIPLLLSALAEWAIPEGDPREVKEEQETPAESPALLHGSFPNEKPRWRATTPS